MQEISHAIKIQELQAKLAIGDLVFIRVRVPLFARISEATMSWTNHVGVVINIDAHGVQVAESRIPLSGITTLQKFVRRSDQGRIAITRLPRSLNRHEVDRLQLAARARCNVAYDTGFSLHSRRQFCSRYVREVIQEATGVSVGQAETFAALLNKNPETRLLFWRLWFLGFIPWRRETVTPASQLNDRQMHLVFDGKAI